MAQSLSLARDRGAAGAYRGFGQEDFNRLFMPVLRHHASISAVMHADSRGNELMLLDEGGHQYLGCNTIGGAGIPGRTYTAWAEQGDTLVLLRTWQAETAYDPRDRPWFQGASATAGPEVYWTSPYKFFNTGSIGITAARRWTERDGTMHVIAYDVSLTDLYHHLFLLRPSPEGRAFIVTHDERLLNVVGDDRFAVPESLLHVLLDSVPNLDLPRVERSLDVWDSLGQPGSGFKMKLQGEEYYAQVVPYVLGSNTLYIGVVVPESDLLGDVRRMRWYLIGGVVVLGIVALLLVRAYHRKTEAYGELQDRTVSAEERNRDMMGSLRYAKGLQEAMLPSSVVMRGFFAESFVLYLPRDVVSGDLYWIDRVGHRVVFAVADCTGHGMPGALLTMVCNNVLQRVVKGQRLTDPGTVLDWTRELVVKNFERGGGEVNDGMDICFCMLEFAPEEREDGPVARLSWAGANQPLWIVRKGAGEVEQHRTDQQPIGRYITQEHFTTYSTELYEGDTLYLTTDGLVDQFGGANNKKLMARGLKQLLLSVQSLDMEQQQERIKQFFHEWKGPGEQIDDVCLMGIRMNQRDRWRSVPGPTVVGG
jgi:serine phosphatase RsbU (regulator of sigma subunit)